VNTRVERSAGGVVFRAGAENSFEIALILTHEGRWQLPKGWIEDGEPPAQAALREVREEAGVDAAIVAPLETIEYWYKSTYDPEPVRVHKFVQFFLLRYLSGETADHDDEVQDARFVEIEDALSRLAFKDERNMVSLAKAMLEEAAAPQEAT
jgi:8-oxo-dGTP pyrophosphatase MutT (NUDIX family)